METTSTGAHCALSRFHSRFRPNRTVSPTTAISTSGLPQKCCPAESLTAKKDAMERALERARRNQPTLPELFGVRNREPGRSTYPRRDVVRRVAGILLAASRQLPLDLLGAAQFEAFVDCCGGTVDKSKTEYVKLLPGAIRFLRASRLQKREPSQSALLRTTGRVQS